jgi:threonine synthase
MRKDITSFSFSDNKTRNTIKGVFSETGYILDPHGAVGYLGLKEYLDKNKGMYGIFLETAHPIKFRDIVEPLINKKIEEDNRLSKYFNKNKSSIKILPDIHKLKTVLINN